MIMKTHFYVKVLLFIFILTSCQSNDLDFPNLSKADLIGEKLKFVSLEERLAEFPSLRMAKKQFRDPDRDKNHMTISKGEEVKNEEIKVFTTVIGRPKYGCTRGFGFCYTCILGIPVGYPYNRSNYQSQMHKVQSSIIERDFLGRYYVDLQLSELPKDIDSRDMPDLKIDESLRARDTTGTSVRIFDIKSKSIKFNPSIGQLGGYRIYLDKSETKINID